MRRFNQYMMLNCIGAAAAVLILVNLFLISGNARLNREIMTAQNQVNRSQVLQTTFQNLVNRVAQEASRDEALRDLLVRHRLLLSGAEPVVEDANAGD